MSLLESRLPVTGITVMVQKEAAARLCARPGTRECGAVTLAVQYYAHPEILFSVSRGSFLPAPNVDSAVIRLTIREKPPCTVQDEARLFRVIRPPSGSGANPRQLPGRRGLRQGGGARRARAGRVEETRRAEELSLAEFAAVADALGA